MQAMYQYTLGDTSDRSAEYAKQVALGAPDRYYKLLYPECGLLFQFQMLARIISNQDLIAFTASIFSIYYLLYFTILDLSASPGKTILGLRLIKTDNTSVSVKHTFTRALISLFSSIALFLPMLLDFQGRLSDTKVVK